MGSLDHNKQRDLGKRNPEGQVILSPVCPDCDEREAVHVALLPIRGPDDRLICEPHHYGVCEPCYAAQYEKVYGIPYPTTTDASSPPAPGP